jgi:hypothetical protein
MNPPRIRNSAALFFQSAIGLVGFATLVWMLWEPHLEGRNAHATNFEIYCRDPFLAYVYAGSVPFFVALYQAFGLFADARRNGSFSPVTLHALQMIKRCAMVMIAFVIGGMVWIALFGDPDERPAGFFMGLLVATAATIIALVATKFARRLQAAFAGNVPCEA